MGCYRTCFPGSKSQRSSEDCFYSVPSPGTMALFCCDLVFHDHSTYVMALADALSQEYQQIAKHGLLLQVPTVSQWFPVLNSDLVGVVGVVGFRRRTRKA